MEKQDWIAPVKRTQFDDTIDFRKVSKATHLPPRLASRYEELVNDREILNLRQDITLVDVRMTEVMDSLSTEDGAVIFKKLAVSARAYKRLKRERRKAHAVKAADRMCDIIINGASDADKWAELMKLMEQRRKMVESERKRMVETSQMMSTAQAMVLLSKIFDSIKKYVTDRDALEAISEDLDRYVNYQQGAS